MEGYINSSVDKYGVGTIEFFHPAHNALPSYLLQELTFEITELSKDSDCKVILLKSGGNRTFCAGASFDELKAIKTEEEGKVFFMGFAHVINAIRKSNKFVIGRVQGKAVGGGVGIAAACDYCFATKYASIKLSELGIGIGPFVIGPAVERKIGVSAFAQMTLDFTKFYDPPWALSKGLYQDFFESHEEMDEHITRFAQKLAEASMDSSSEVKRMLWQGTDHWETLLTERAAISGRLVRTGLKI